MRDHLLRRVVAVALGVSMTLAAYDRLSAYGATGPRWPGSAVSYLVNPANADLSPSAALAAVQAAAAAWSLQTLADIQLQYAGPTSGTTVQLNGLNEVFFSPESSGTTIAVAYWWWNGAGELIDADIKFFDGGYRFETVETGCTGGWLVEDVGAHEFGHVLGLSHSETSGATMYRYIEPCGSSARLLHADDISGLEAIYPPGSGAPPAAPYDLAVALSATQPETSLVLTWVDASSTEAGYHIERSASASGFAELATVPADSTTYVDTGLAPGTTYFYRVHAFNLAGDSLYSSTVSAQTLASPSDLSSPASPDPANDATGVRKPFLSWAAVPGATRYDVYFGTSGSPPFLATTTRARVKVGKLAAGTLYHWRVVAHVDGASVSGTTWSFTNGRRGEGR